MRHLGRIGDLALFVGAGDSFEIWNRRSPSKAATSISAPWPNFACGCAAADPRECRLDFAVCHHCGRDLVRPKAASGAKCRADFGMLGALANLGKLVTSEVEDDSTGIEADGQYVIRLPHTGTTKH
eukprot:tig00001467_g8754.t1